MTDLLFDWFDFNQRASKYVSNSIEVRYQLTSDSKQVSHRNSETFPYEVSSVTRLGIFENSWQQNFLQKNPK